MLFYYAYTGHKIGLESVRRGVALLNRLNEKGIETRLLVNDFRAGLVARDLGASAYVTIETVQDIDAIAETGDSIIIDSREDDHGRLVKFCADFKHVWRFAHDKEDYSIHGERLFEEDCESEVCENALIVDANFFEAGTKKKERLLFFLGDADYDKTVLGNAEFFKAMEMELLLGNYFFVKYEDDLAKIFTTLHEPEEYVDLMKESTHLVTASSQAAMEAKACGTKVIYLELGQNTLYSNELLTAYGIDIVKGFDAEAVKEALKRVQDRKGRALEIPPFKNLLKEFK